MHRQMLSWEGQGVIHKDALMGAMEVADSHVYLAGVDANPGSKSRNQEITEGS